MNDPATPPADLKLREAIQWVLDWELDYRTLNHLGPHAPMVFTHLEKMSGQTAALAAQPATTPAGIREIGTNIVHAPDCVAVLDDESDYEYLADAGTCTCGARD